MKRKAFKAAFPYTLPILAGFSFLGMAYGIYMNASGFSFVYPLCMSFLIYGGSLEFVAVEMLEKNTETEYVPVHRCRNDKLYAVTAFLLILFLTFKEVSMKKLNWFARPEKFRNRLIMVILGVLIQGFGLSWLIEIHFGTDPCSAFTQGVISHIGLTFGTAQLLINLILFIIIFLSDTSLIGFGTIANMIFIGYISDTCRWIYSRIFPAHFFESMPVRICILLPALIVFIFGAAMYMTAALGTSPYDAISFILAKKVPHVPFKYVRIAWDTSFLLLGWIAGGNVGPVTFAIAFFLGPVISWEQKKLAVFIS